MDIKEVRDFWFEEAEEALRVARHLYEKEDYSYALFFGQLAVEKLLKSIYAIKMKEQPPYLHNLLRLAELSGISLPQDMKDALARITAFGIEARYPDEKRSFRKKCTNKFTHKELEKIEEVFKWLKSTTESLVQSGNS